MDFEPTYKTRADFPSGTPTATIYFNGLLCVFFDGEKECTVAVNKAPLHALQFGIWKKGTCEKITVDLKQEINEINEMRIDVINPVKSGVHVYAPESGSTAGADQDRYSYVKYCLDLEGPKFHNSPVEKKTEMMWPRFYINNGLFSAYRLSESRFALKKGNGQNEIGVIGLALAADIFLNEGGSINFLADGATDPVVSLPLMSDDSYEIAITNSCSTHVYDPVSNDRTRRNDFYLHYRVVDVKPEEQFELVNIDVRGSTGATKLGGCVARDDHPVSDPSPCQHLGFGLTPRLTGPPPQSS